MLLMSSANPNIHLYTDLQFKNVQKLVTHYMTISGVYYENLEKFTTYSLSIQIRPCYKSILSLQLSCFCKLLMFSLHRRCTQEQF
jgi:hypothetical protein